jgi:hypothetical protein
VPLGDAVGFFIGAKERPAIATGPSE